MKKNVGPIALGIAVVALIGFVYYMYKSTQPDVQSAPDPRNGPPGYVKQMQSGGGSSMQAPQAPGQPLKK